METVFEDKTRTKVLLMAPKTTSLLDRSFSVANCKVKGCLQRGDRGADRYTWGLYTPEVYHTPRKINMEPENDGLENDFPF